jgi:glucosylceramidase
LSPQQELQTLDGFGATLTNSSAAVLESLSPSALNQELNSLFNPQTGAGISVIRLSMGANDFSANGCSPSLQSCNAKTADYTYDDMPQPSSSIPYCRDQTVDPNMECFSLYPYDADIVSILQAALAINPNITIIASPWTAPPWMKTNTYCQPLIQLFLRDHSCRYTASDHGTLSPSDYGAYANYFVSYIEAYAAKKITINYVTPQNEPGNATSNYPGMLFNPSDETNFVDNFLSPALSSAHLSTNILDYDWNWYAPGTPNGTCQNRPGSEGTNECWSQGQIGSALADAPPNVAGLAWHCYSAPPFADIGGEPGPMAQETFASKVSFITECTGKDSPKIGDTNFGYDLKWDSSYLIAGGPQYGASGVEFYNLALNQLYGPQNGGGCNNLCRGVVTINTETGQVTNNVEYWLLTEAARAFEPGATVIANSTSASSCATWTNLCAVAALNPDGTTGLYVANPTNGPISFSVNDGGYGFSNYSLASESVVSFNWTNPTGSASGIGPPAS